MEVGETAFGDEVERVAEHVLGLGRESGDEIGTEDDVGAQPARLRAEADGIAAHVAALHALQDEIVAGLQGKMQVRHEAGLGRNCVHEIAVRLHLIDRGQAQARKAGHMLQDLLDEASERGATGKPRAIRRDVDARQHDLAAAAVDEPGDLGDDLAGRNRSRRPAPVGDDAERAAMIAPVLHLDVGACPRSEAVDHVMGGLA